MLIKEKELKRNKIILLVTILFMVSFLALIVVKLISERNNNKNENNFIVNLFVSSKNKVKIKSVDTDILENITYLSLREYTDDNFLEVKSFGKINPFEPFLGEEDILEE